MFDPKTKPMPHEIPPGWKLWDVRDALPLKGQGTLVYAADGKSFVPWDGELRGQFALVRAEATVS